MAFLISIAEVFNKPGGLWEILILNLFEFITNYGWRILLFTVCLKLLLFPLDLYQRLKMHKNQMITKKLQPQIEKIKEQYAGNKQMLNQKQMELNKREGFSYWSTCLPMIVTMVIFFYLFSGLQNISYYMNLKQYAELYDQYEHTRVLYESGEKDIVIKVNGEDKEIDYALHMASKPSGNETSQEYIVWLNVTDQLEREISIKAKDSVVDYYEATKESFLWIKNIWSPDVPWTKPILDEEGFTRNIGKYSDVNNVRKKLNISEADLSNSDFTKMINLYGVVTDHLAKSDSNSVNGFLILPILSVGLSFLSQFITNKLQKKSGQNMTAGGMGGGMKMMMFFMPVMMGFFALSYTSAFTLYIVVNSTMSILINLLTTFFLNMKTKNMERVNPDEVIRIGRPDPNDIVNNKDKKKAKKDETTVKRLKRR